MAIGLWSALKMNQWLGNGAPWHRFSAATLTSCAPKWWVSWQKEPVFPAHSHYFLVPKKDSGLRPILDLRHLNHVLMKRPFRMITSKQILMQICPGNWFFSLDLKDAYFHIQIAPPPQAVHEIRLRGSGLSAHGPPLWAVPGSPHFYKVKALSQLRQMGIRILNYLDDWLISRRTKFYLTDPCSSAT